MYRSQDIPTARLLAGDAAAKIHAVFFNDKMR
jgi:hypothetical protein